MSRKKSFRIATAATSALVGVLAACGSPGTGSTAAGGTSNSPAAQGPAVTSLAPGHKFTLDQISQAKYHPEWSQYTFTIADNGNEGVEALSRITDVFKDAPYQVKFAHFTFGPPLIQALVTGAADIGDVGDVPPITGAAKTLGFKIVGVYEPADPNIPQEDIIVPKDSTLKTAADLKGKTIAVPQGSSAHGLTLLTLKNAGLTPDDVQLDFLDPAPGAAAFNSGKVDAWAIWEPQITLAEKNGARVLVPGLPPNDQVTNYFVASDKALGDPARKTALTDVFYRIALEYQYATTHTDDYAKALSQESGILLADEESVAKETGRTILPIRDSDTKAEQGLADAFLQAKQIDKKVDLSAITEQLLPAGFDSRNLDTSGFPKT